MVSQSTVVFPEALLPVLGEVDEALVGSGLDHETQVSIGSVVYAAAMSAFEAGQKSALAEVRSGYSVATELGCSGGRLRQLSAELGVGTKIPVGNMEIWVYQPADVAALKARPDRRGRPGKGEAS